MTMMKKKTTHYDNDDDCTPVTTTTTTTTTTQTTIQHDSNKKGREVGNGEMSLLWTKIIIQLRDIALGALNIQPRTPGIAFLQSRCG